MTCDNSKLGFKLQLNHNLNYEGKYVMVIVQSNMIRLDTEVEMAKIRVGYRYDMLNFDSLKLERDQTLPNEFTSFINSEVLSTTRGIFYSEVRGTNLHNKIMPSLSPNDLKRIK